jgi:DNA-binding response OmpR family regulator
MTEAHPPNDETTLEAAGYEVGEAPDGARRSESHGNGDAWDVVVLDQRMAGMDGLETLRLLRAGDPTARVIMATA